MYFDILNRLGLDHYCDGQRNRPTKRPLAIVCYNINLLDAC